MRVLMSAPLVCIMDYRFKFDTSGLFLLLCKRKQEINKHRKSVWLLTLP